MSVLVMAVVWSRRSSATYEVFIFRKESRSKLADEEETEGEDTSGRGDEPSDNEQESEVKLDEAEERGEDLEMEQTILKLLSTSIGIPRPISLYIL